MQRSIGNARVILSIQYLRALAALGVAIYHIGNHAGVSFEVGAAGVDLFFLISGFIMWTVTVGKRSGPGLFLADRVTRIAPPYILLTVLTYLTARYVPAVFPNMRTNLSHAALSVLFVPHVDPQGTSFPQIVSGWTLNYEMFFYVVFAIMLFVPERARVQVSTAVLIFLPVTGLLTAGSSPIVRAYTSPLLLEFCAGLWLGAAWRNGWLPGSGWGGIGLATGVAGFVLWQALQGTDPGAWRALMWGLPALLVVGGALAVERQKEVAGFWPLLLVGNASYSIYLVNAFTTAAAWRLMRGLPLPLYYMGGIVASVSGGLAFWWVVERPLTRVIRQRLHRPIPISEAVPPAVSAAP